MNMNEPKEQARESIAADVAELGGEIAVDGVIEGAFELAATAGDTFLSAAGELVGGIIEGI